MQGRVRILVARIVALSLFLVLPLSWAQENVLRIGGAEGTLGTITDLVEVFRRDHPGIEVRVLPHLGSSGSLNALLDGRIDIALIARALSEEERARGLSAHPYAETPLTFLAHPGVQDEDVTTRMLIELYRGQRTTWGDGSRCRPILRAAHDPDTELLSQFDPGLAVALESALGRSDLIVALSAQQNADVIREVPGSLGYGTRSQVVSEDLDVKILTFNGRAPVMEEMHSGNYPLRVSFAMVTGTRPKPDVRAFLALLRSERGRQVVEANGNLFVDGERF